MIKKRFNWSFAVVWLCLGLIVPNCWAGEGLSNKKNKHDEQPNTWYEKIKITGSLWEYYLWQDNNFFLEDSKDSWLESIGRIGAEADITEQLSAQLQVILEATHGDADTLTGVQRDGANVELELANFTYKELFDMPLAVTLGRQNLEFGDGFLIYDGYYDRKAAWVTPIRSFNAAKVSYTPDAFTLDLFFANTIIDYQSFEVFLGDLAIISGDRNL